MTEDSESSDWPFEEHGMGRFRTRTHERNRFIDVTESNCVTCLGFGNRDGVTNFLRYFTIQGKSREDLTEDEEMEADTDIPTMDRWDENAFTRDGLCNLCNGNGVIETYSCSVCNTALGKKAWHSREECASNVIMWSLIELCHHGEKLWIQDKDGRLQRNQECSKCFAEDGSPRLW